MKEGSQGWFFPTGWSPAILVFWLALLLADAAKHALMLGADPPPPQLDAYAYWHLGRQLAAGDWLLTQEQGAFRTPGYPLFIAPFTALFGRFAMLAILIAQHLLVMGASLVSAAISARLTGRSWVGLLAYAISTVCFARDWHANLLLTETVFAFLLILVMALFVRYLNRPSAGAAALVGVTIGLATLVRPISTYLWVPLSAIVLLRAVPWRFLTGQSERQSAWKSVRHAILLSAAVYLTLSPWLLRNQVLFGSPFMTRFLGRNLWVVTFEPQSGSGLTLGNGPASSELREHLAGIDQTVVIEDTWSVSRGLAAAGLPDDQIDALMLRVCRELIADARPLVAYKTFRRTVNFWRCVSNPFPFYNWNPEQTDYYGQWVWKSPTVTAAYRTVNRYAISRSLRMNELAILAVTIGGVCLWWNRDTRLAAVALALVLLYFDVVTATLEIPGYRYRMILEPLMVVCIAAAVAKAVGVKATK